jgi:hypothetical protein
MIPGLESRLMESEEEELRLVADLGHILFHRRQLVELIYIYRFKKVSPVLVPTIPRA